MVLLTKGLLSKFLVDSLNPRISEVISANSFDEGSAVLFHICFQIWVKGQVPVRYRQLLLETRAGPKDNRSRHISSHHGYLLQPCEVCYGCVRVAIPRGYIPWFHLHLDSRYGLSVSAKIWWGIKTLVTPCVGLAFLWPKTSSSSRFVR